MRGLRPPGSSDPAPGFTDHNLVRLCREVWHVPGWNMDADEKDICEFLKSWQGQFVAVKEICRRAGGKWRFKDDPNWAVPVLQRMLEQNLVESDTTGHFRLIPEKQKKDKKWWLSPEHKKILEQSGKFDGVVDIPDEPEDEKK
jgi:hypothetical protein